MNAQPSTLEAAIRDCAAAVAATAAGIREDQLENPTPCQEYSVAELLAHLGGALKASARAARKEAQPGTDAPSESAKALAEDADRVAVAWADPAAYEGLTEFGPGEMPAHFAAAITLQELALHGWDLARATDQSFVVGEDAGEVVLGVVEQIGERARSNGGYGEAVSVPAGASALQRAVGASGRDPEWSR